MAREANAQCHASAHTVKAGDTFSAPRRRPDAASAFQRGGLDGLGEDGDAMDEEGEDEPPAVVPAGSAAKQGVRFA